MKNTDLKDFFRHPLEDPKFPVKLFIGTVLLFPGIALVLPLFLVLGYLHRVLLAAIRHKSERLPEYDRMAMLLVQGVTAFLVWLAYLVPAAVLGAVALIPSMAAGSGGLFAPQNILSTFLRVGSLVLVLGGYFFLPMALARFACKGKLSAAFQVREIVSQIKRCSNEYLLLSVCFALGSLGLGWVANFLSGFPLGLGNLVSMALCFYFSIVMMLWTGVLYRETFPVSKPASPEPAATEERPS